MVYTASTIFASPTREDKSSAASSDIDVSKIVAQFTLHEKHYQQKISTTHEDPDSTFSAHIHRVLFLQNFWNSIINKYPDFYFNRNISTATEDQKTLDHIRQFCFHIAKTIAFYDKKSNDFETILRYLIPPLKKLELPRDCLPQDLEFLLERSETPDLGLDFVLEQGGKVVRISPSPQLILNPHLPLAASVGSLSACDTDSDPSSANSVRRQTPPLEKHPASIKAPTHKKKKKRKATTHSPDAIEMQQLEEQQQLIQAIVETTRSVTDAQPSAQEHDAQPSVAPTPVITPALPLLQEDYAPQQPPHITPTASIYSMPPSIVRDNQRNLLPLNQIDLYPPDPKASPVPPNSPAYCIETIVELPYLHAKISHQRTEPPLQETDTKKAQLIKQLKLDDDGIQNFWSKQCRFGGKLHARTHLKVPHRIHALLEYIDAHKDKDDVSYVKFAIALDRLRRKKAHSFSDYFSFFKSPGRSKTTAAFYDANKTLFGAIEALSPQTTLHR